MPQIRDVLRFLELVEKHQPAHAYGLAVALGSPSHVAITWKWLQYLEELDVVRRYGQEKYKTGRKQYVLTDEGERLLSALKETFGGKRTLTVSSFSRSRRLGSQI